ncbi:MAG: hypothetical protein IPM56_15990 [Ignavibacteriales bacterium]|nr:MAG: hypothetical protein IPM56_15990 [Ignavibacteriales bacterium]
MMEDTNPNNENTDAAEQQDNRTTEEKISDSVKKIRPYLTRLKESRKKLVVFNSIVFVLMLGYLLFLTKPYYSSSVTILPEYGNKSTTLSRLSSLAALAGVNVGEGAPTEIYQNLIMSEAVLEPVIYSNYYSEKLGDSVNLLQYYEIESENDPPTELDKRKMFLSAFKALTERVIKTDRDRLTGIMTVTVTAGESGLAAALANRITSSLDNYIRTKRKSFASEQRYYLEKRTEQVKDSLTKSETALKVFREQNRLVAQSPQLLLEQARLLREVEIQQEVYIELTKQLEIAKIDEIKETPVVNIKEEAKDPVIKAGPSRARSLMIVMFLSLAASALYFMFKPQLTALRNAIKK